MCELRPLGSYRKKFTVYRLVTGYYLSTSTDRDLQTQVFASSQVLLIKFIIFDIQIQRHLGRLVIADAGVQLLRIELQFE